MVLEGCKNLKILHLAPSILTTAITDSLVRFHKDTDKTMEVYLTATTESCYGFVNSETCMERSILIDFIVRFGVKLRRLNLSNVTSVNDSVLFLIAEHCTNLKEISFGHESSKCRMDDITVAGFRALLKLGRGRGGREGKKLRRVKFGYTNIIDGDLSILEIWESGLDKESLKVCRFVVVDDGMLDYIDLAEKEEIVEKEEKRKRRRIKLEKKLF